MAAAAIRRSPRTRIHAHTRTGSHAPRGPAPLQTAALRLCTYALLRGRGPRGCGVQWRHWRPRSGDRGGGWKRRPAGRENSGRELPPERPSQETSERETPCAPWTYSGQREAPGTGVLGRSQLLRGCPRPSLRFPGVGATRSRGDRRAGGPGAERLCAAARLSWRRQLVALIHLMRPDGSRSPQHGFCVFSFLSWLIFFNWCFRRVWAAA